MSATMPAKKFGNRYPWGRWFAKTQFTLRTGADYHVSSSAMAGNVRAKASALRKSVSLEVGDGYVKVTVMGDLPCRK